MRKIHITCSVLIELAFALLVVCCLCSISEQSGSATFHVWLTIPLGLLFVSHLAWLLSRWYFTIPFIIIGALLILGKWLLDEMFLAIMCAQLLLYVLVCVNHRKTVKYLKNK